MGEYSREEVELVKMYRGLSEGLKKAVLDLIKHISTVKEEENGLSEMQQSKRKG